jgi:hypothetical protein
MSTYSFQLIQYDSERPWIVLADERPTVDLPDGQDFAVWSARQFPDGQYRAVLRSTPSARITS